MSCGVLVRKRLFKVWAEPDERGQRGGDPTHSARDGAVPQLDEGLVVASGAVRVLQEEMCELERTLVERTKRERQLNLGKILNELAENHITQKQLKIAHAGDLERDRLEAATDGR